MSSPAASGAPSPSAPSPGAFGVWFAFVKMGAVLFGGGYAMLGLLEREIVQRRRWISSREMQDYFALAQLLPGVIAINASMLVGNRLAGLRGNVAAAAGVVTVPFLCIAAYAVAYDSVRTLPAVAGMIAGFGLAMVRKAGKTRPALALAIATCALSVAFDPPIIGILALCVAAGAVWAFFVRRRARKAGM